MRGISVSCCCPSWAPWAERFLTAGVQHIQKARSPAPLWPHCAVAPQQNVSWLPPWPQRMWSVTGDILQRHIWPAQKYQTPRMLCSAVWWGTQWHLLSLLGSVPTGNTACISRALYNKSYISFWIIQTDLPAVDFALFISLLQQGGQILREKQEQGSSMRWTNTSEGHPTATSVLSDKAGAHTQWAGCWKKHTSHQRSQSSWGDEPGPSRKAQCRHRFYPGPETGVQASYLQGKPKV